MEEEKILFIDDIRHEINYKTNGIINNQFYGIISLEMFLLDLVALMIL